MRSLLVCILFFHSLLAFDYKLEPKKVNATTYCFLGLPEAINEHNNGNMVNSCFVDMGSSYLVVDSGPTYLYASQAYAKMKIIKDIPVSYVINTHVHDDHWLGNGYYKEMGAKIVGSVKFQDEAKQEETRMQRRISKEAYAKTTQIFPDIFVDKEKTLTIDGKNVLITGVNKKAHTSSDLLVYISDYSSLFVGDIIFNDRLPSLRDGNIVEWIKELEKIKALHVSNLIGGHGYETDSTTADFTLSYLTELKSKVAQAIENGQDIEEAINSIKMPSYEKIPMYDTMQKQNIETAYRTLEWAQ
jgi:glyoxylase-like metal-dependent hydrolase (beta-lactamase superfamily II)